MRTSLLVLSLLFCSLVFGQSSFTRVENLAISLSSVGQADNGHSERSGSALLQEVTNNDCTTVFHRVTNVQTSNGPDNSGTYFTVSITIQPVTGAQAINFKFGAPENNNDIDTYFSIIDTTGNTQTAGTVGTCTTGTCTFQYYCGGSYPNLNTLEVELWTSQTVLSTTVEFTSYDITVDQHIDLVGIIPASRTFSQSAPISRPYVSTNVGPENFVHFYHDLERTDSERTANAGIFIEVTDFSVAQTVQLCYSWSGLVASTQNINAPTSNLQNGLPDINFTPSTVNAPNGCSISCSSFPIVDIDSILYTTIAPCSCDDDSDLWIGLTLPQAATFTLAITSRNFPPVTDIVSSGVSVFGAELNDVCDVGNGDFSCNKYYKVSSLDKSDLGYLYVEFYSIINLDFSATITTSNVGFQSDCTCGTELASCDDQDENCIMSLYSCDYAEYDSLYISVAYEGSDDLNIPHEFGLRVTSGAQTVTPITLNTETTDLAGTIRAGQHKFYSVSFTESDIFDDSNFNVEMYTGKVTGNSVVFSWNYNEIAGVGSCFNNLGSCATSSLCDDYDDVIDTGDYTLSCRYSFYACDIHYSQDDYINSPYAYWYNHEQHDDDDDNAIISSLRAGIYYFSVSSPSSVVENFNPEYDFTLKFNYNRAIRLFDNVVSIQHVFFPETQQYVVDVSNRENVVEVVAIIDGVKNGWAVLYGNCGSPAGPCPCYGYEHKCFAASADFDAVDYYWWWNYDIVNQSLGKGCSVKMQTCECNEDEMYFAVRNSQSVNLGTDDHKPVMFNIEVSFHTVANKAETIPEVAASRSGTVSIGLIDTISNGEQFGSYFLRNQPNLIDYYSVSFSGLDIGSDDVLSFKLTILNDYINNGYADVFSSDYYPRGYWNGESFVTDDDLYYEVSTTMSMYITEDRLISFHDWLFADSNTDDDGAGQEQCGYHSCIAFNQLDDSTLHPFCSVALKQCNACDQRMVFNPETQYFISVVNNSPIGYSNFPILYSVETKVTDISPLPILLDTPIIGELPVEIYHHYVFNSANIPANSGISFQLYRNAKESSPLDFYLNANPDNEIQRYAGRLNDCYDSNVFCKICQINGQVTNSCIFNVSPVLNSQIGASSYYMSVYQGGASITAGYWWWDNNFFETDDDDRLQTQTFEYANHVNYDISYTIKVEAMSIRPLLNGLNTIPYAETIPRTIESNFYSINVPALSGNIIGRTLRIAISATNNDIDVLIQTTTPSEQTCLNGNNFEGVSSGETKEFYRYPCEFESSIYYVEIRHSEYYLGDHFVENSDLPYEYIFYADDDDGNCSADAEYAIHAVVESIEETVITLASNNVDSRIRNSFYSVESTNEELNSIVVEPHKTSVYRFNMNINEGDYFSMKLLETTGGPANLQFNLAVNGYILDTNRPSEGIFGLNADTSQCAAAIASDVLVPGADYFVFFDPCDLPKGNNEYYLTFYFNSGSTPSSIINIELEQYSSLNIINVPTDFTDTTTTLTVTDSETDSQFKNYLFSTTTTMGLNGGETLSFSVSNAFGLYVNYGGETGPNCPVTCEHVTGAQGVKTCTVSACETISPAIWFIYIDGIPVTAPTVTIRRDQAIQTSNPSQITNLVTNTEFSSVNGLQNNEFQYFTYSLPASSSSQFDILLGGSITTTNMFAYDSSSTRKYFPGVTQAQPQDIMMYATGSTSNTCGFTPFGALPSYDCCYSNEVFNFVVVGPVLPSFTITPEVVQYVGTTSAISSSGIFTGVITDTNLINFHTFSISANSNLYFDFQVQTGTNVNFYWNYGTTAGASTTPVTNPAHCFDTAANFANVCPTPIAAGGNGCSGFRMACVDTVCNGDSNLQYTIGVTGTTADAYTIELRTVTATSTLATGVNTGLQFPDPILIGDNSGNTNAFEVNSQYIYTYTRDSNTIVMPTEDTQFGPSTSNPRVQFTFNNFRQTDGTTIPNPASTNEINIFINSGPAGDASNSCLGGSQLGVAASTVYPCIENNGAGSIDATSVTCSIDVCALSCNDQIYFGIERTNPTTTNQYVFDVSITEIFDDFTTSVPPVIIERQLTVQSVGQSILSYTPIVGQETTVLYVDITEIAPSPASTRRFDFDYTGPAGTVTLSWVNQGDTCQPTNFVNECPTLPCTMFVDTCEQALKSKDPQRYYARILSSSNQPWTATLTYTVTNVNVLDFGTQTTLTPTIVDGVNQVVTYSAEKVIIDGEYQFFDFIVSGTEGYSTFQIDVTEVSCFAQNQNLEVFYSFGHDGNTEYFDYGSSNDYYPTASCINPFASTTPSSSGLVHECEVSDGSYRVGIFAPIGTQIFPDPADPLVNPSEYPAVYSITATLTTTPHIEIGHCETFDVADFVPYMEFDISTLSGPQSFTDANFRVTVTFNDDIDDINGPITVTLNRERPYPFPDDDCNQPDTYTCTASDNDDDSCTFVVDVDAINGRYFLYVPYTGTTTTGTITINIEIDSPFVNIIDGTVASSNTYTLFDSGKPSYDLQYHRLILPDEPVVIHFNTNDHCDDTDDIDIALQSYHTDCDIGHMDEVDSCDDEDECFLVVDPCDYYNSELYILIHTDDDDDDFHTLDYTIEITPISEIQTSVLAPGDSLCIQCEKEPIVFSFETDDFSDYEFHILVNEASVAYWEVDFDGCLGSSNNPCDGAGDCTEESVNSCSDFGSILVIPDDDECCGQNWSISLSDETVDVSVSINIGSAPLSVADDIDVAVLSNPTSQWLIQSNENGVFSNFAYNCDDNSCNEILPRDADTIIFNSNLAGLQVSTLNVVSLSSSNSQTFTASSVGFVQYFSFSAQSFGSTYSVVIDNISDTDASFSVGISDSMADLSADCNSDICTVLSNTGLNACGDSLSIPITTQCEVSVYYVAVGVCGLPCGGNNAVSFNVFVDVDNSAISDRVAINGGTHKNPFTAISSPTTLTSQCAASSVVSRKFSVVTDELLYVSLRNYNLGIPASISATYSCGDTVGCSIDDDDASCGDGESDCSEGHCATSVDPVFVDVTGSPYVEYQVITSSVSLTSSDSGSMFGETAHFYKISYVEEALTINIVVDGPALYSELTDASCSGDELYIEKIIYPGDHGNYYSFPTRGSLPRNDLYLSLYSGINDFSGFEKVSTYTVSLVRGTANCGSPVSTGFCSSVFANGASALVWTQHVDMDGQNDAALCASNSYDICGMTNECKSFIDLYSCYKAFPYCDEQGFQVAPCQDLCFDMNDACGYNSIAADDDEYENPQWYCNSDFNFGSPSSCFNAVESAEKYVEDSFNPLTDLFGEDGEQDGESGANNNDLNEITPIVVPVFETIEATMPPIILDDDDGKMIANEKNMIIATDSASSTIFSFFLLVAVLAISLF